MQDQFLEFAEWTPDQGNFATGGMADVKNVIPSARGYLPLKSLSAGTTALAERCQGAISVLDSSGTQKTYAGTATYIYETTLTAATSRTRTASNYTTNAAESWEFILWGDKVLGVNGTDTPQLITIGGSNFADLGGSPPVARHVTSVGEFVVMGNIGSSNKNRVQWSAIGNEAGWTAGTSQSGYQDIPGEGGNVQAIVGFENNVGIIVRERDIWRMTYIGAPEVFQFDRVAVNIGTAAPNSVVSYGRDVYFLSEEGFYSYKEGTGLSPIGAEKVNRYFLENHVAGNISRMSSAIDPVNNIIFWSYNDATATDATPNAIIIYNTQTQKWSRADEAIEFVFKGQHPAYTLEDLDAVSSSLDALTISLDSPYWDGGQLLLAGFNQSHVLGFFDGSSKTAVLDTEEFGGDRLMCVNELRPYIEGASGTTTTLNMLTRSSLTGSLTTGSAVSLNDDGLAHTRSTSRFTRVRCNIASGFDIAKGVNIRFMPQGRR